jgi:hypothetical protein
LSKTAFVSACNASSNAATSFSFPSLNVAIRVSDKVFCNSSSNFLFFSSVAFFILSSITPTSN